MSGLAVTDTRGADVADVRWRVRRLSDVKREGPSTVVERSGNGTKRLTRPTLEWFIA
jgi:hypothetical protein